MRKLLSILVMALIMVVATNEAKAQIAIGGGVAYATGISSPGFFVKGTYDFDDTWGAAAHFTYYLPKDGLKWWSFGADARYKLMESDAITLRGVAGIIVTGTSFDWDTSDIYDIEYKSTNDEFDDLFDDLGDVSTSSTNIGFALGANAEFSLSDNVVLFGEPRYIFASGGYFAIQAGVMFKLGE